MPRARRCSYCGVRGVSLTRDHIVPRSAGGPTFGWNTALACRPCNQLKDDHVMIRLDLLWANYSRGRARGLKIVYPPNAIVRYVAKQLWAMRQGKPFRSLGRGRYMGMEMTLREQDVAAADEESARRAIGRGRYM
jgi:hypothetical protein